MDIRYYISVLLLCCSSSVFAQDPEILTRRTPAFVFQEGYSVTFDGVDEYIEIPDHDDFSFTDGSGNDQPFSLFIWMNRENSTNTHILIAKYHANAEYMLWLTGTTLRMQCFYGDYRHYMGRTAPMTTVDEWIGIAMTYDGSESSSGIKLYSITISGTVTRIDNGSLFNSAYGGMVNRIMNLRIGTNSHTQLVFEGKLAFPLIANKELSVAELEEIGKAPNGDYRNVSFCDNIVSAWYFENGTGDFPTYTDYKSGHNGTLTNMQESNISIDKPE